MNTFIGKDPRFPAEIREMIESNPLVIVSGQPLNFFGANGKDFFLQDCEFVIDLPLFVTTAIMKQIPAATHPHVPEIFTGNCYPIVSGFSSTYDQYVFGVHPELGFQIRPYESD